MGTDLERPEIADIEQGYVFVWPLTAVRIELSRFLDKRGELRAEMTIARTPLGSNERLLHEAELNLLSTTSRNAVVKMLAAQEEDVNWTKLLEHLCFLAKRRYREGTPAIHCRDIHIDNRPRFALRPYVEYGRPTVLFGPGSSTKTYAGVAAAVSWATGLPIFGEPMADPLPVLFMDYETDQSAFGRRLMAIRRGHGVEREPDVYYRRLYGPFTESAAAVRAEAKRLGVGYLCLDSLAGAVGGELIDPRFIMPFFDAIARFELPTLIISHVNADTVREREGGNGHLMPFGTVYTENAAGNTWSIRRRSEQGAAIASIFLRHEKVNEGPQQPDHGYGLNFTMCPAYPDVTWSVEYERQDARHLDAFEDKMSVADRIFAYLTRRGAQHLKPMAEELDIPESQVNARARDLIRRGVVIQLQDRRYAVLAQERDANG